MVKKAPHILNVRKNGYLRNQTCFFNGIAVKDLSSTFIFEGAVSFFSQADKVSYHVTATDVLWRSTG